MTGCDFIGPSKGLADRLAADVFATLGIPAEPPVDIARIAKLLGVCAITAKRMVEDGRLEHVAGAAEILVKQDVPETRRRFTVAHEVAHLLLINPGDIATAYRAARSVDDLERFCDALAASLLLPRPWVAAHYSHRIENLSTVRSLAHHTKTSLGASVVRLNQVLGWTHAIVTWNMRQDRWRYQHAAGLPSQLHRSVRTTPAARERIAELGRRSQRDSWTTLALIVGGREATAPAHVSVRRTTAIALVDYRPLLP